MLSASSPGIYAGVDLAIRVFGRAMDLVFQRSAAEAEIQPRLGAASADRRLLAVLLRSAEDVCSFHYPGINAGAIRDAFTLIPPVTACESRYRILERGPENLKLY